MRDRKKEKEKLEETERWTGVLQEEHCPSEDVSSHVSGHMEHFVWHRNVIGNRCLSPSQYRRPGSCVLSLLVEQENFNFSGMLNTMVTQEQEQ